jgi:hypothetical protein
LANLSSNLLALDDYMRALKPAREPQPEADCRASVAAVEELGCTDGALAAADVSD